MVASNGSITITLVAKPTTAPVASDFSATYAIIAPSITGDLFLENFSYDGDKTIEFTFSPIEQTLYSQTVIITIDLAGTKTQALPFIVEGFLP